MVTKKRKEYNLFAWTPVNRRRELSQWLLNFKKPPYPPSWIERLNSWVDGLSLPAFLFYIVVAFIPRLLGLVIGVYTVNNFITQDPLFLVITFEGFYYHYLSYGLALDALRKIRGLIPSKIKYRNLEYSLVVLPRKTLAVLSILAVLAGLLWAAIRTSQLADPELSTIGFLTVQTMNWALAINAGVLSIYRLAHQLLVVNRITKLVRVDLFNLRPVYSLSSHMALESFVLVAFLYSNVIIASFFISYTLTSIAVVSLISLIAMACFLFPMLGINRKLVAAKRRMLEITDGELRTVFSRFSLKYETTRAKSGGNIDQLVNAIIRKREYINGISTWPFETSTIRNLLTGGILPFILWLLQQGLVPFFR